MSNCKTKKCGCLDTGLTTPTPCEHDTILCPNPDPCPETFSDCCVIHDGDGIAELNIQTGDRLCDILQKIALAISITQGTTIESVTVVGNDLIITMTDGTIFTTPLPSTTVPNDAWIPLTEADMTLIVPASTATLNTIDIDLLYKILSEDTVMIKGVLRLDITTLLPSDSINFNWRWPAFTGSNWFIGSKTIQGILQRVPVTIINLTNPLVSTFSQVGTIQGSTVGGANFMALGQTTVGVPAGNYVVEVHFEFTAPLQ